MRAEWVDKISDSARALTMAVLERRCGADKMENKEEMSTIVGKRQWFNVPVPDIVGGPRRHQLRCGRVERAPAIHEVLERARLYPFKSHDLWFVTEDVRWGKFEPTTTDTKALVEKVNREDSGARPQRSSRCRPPTSRRRPHAARRTFFDGKVFDPANPAAYLKSLSIKRLESERTRAAAHRRPVPNDRRRF